VPFFCFLPSPCSSSLFLFLLQQHYTHNALTVTRWIFEATHVILDELKPVSPELYEGEGRSIVGLEWIQNSFFAGESLDVEDEKYKIVKQEIKLVDRRERDRKRLRGGRVHPVRRVRRKSESSRGELRPSFPSLRESSQVLLLFFSASKKKPSWTYEVVLLSEDHSTPSHRPTRAPTVPWTEEECEVSPSIQPVEKKRSP